MAFFAILVAATSFTEPFDRLNATTDTPESMYVSVPAVQPVLREILAEMEDPPGAQGQRLTLVRYTIAPAAELTPHVHPGVQMASIVSGELTYHVITGTAVVHRSVAGDGMPTATEELIGPAQATLSAGDFVIEDGNMLHFGANTTDEPVVILATLITKAGQPLAIPIASTSTH